jgi:hypothetical protein
MDSKNYVNQFNLFTYMIDDDHIIINSIMYVRDYEKQVMNETEFDIMEYIDWEYVNNNNIVISDGISVDDGYRVRLVAKSLASELISLKF